MAAVLALLALLAAVPALLGGAVAITPANRETEIPDDSAAAPA